jgi:hypothetical protein
VAAPEQQPGSEHQARDPLLPQQPDSTRAPDQPERRPQKQLSRAVVGVVEEEGVVERWSSLDGGSEPKGVGVKRGRDQRRGRPPPWTIEALTRVFFARCSTELVSKMSLDYARGEVSRRICRLLSFIERRRLKNILSVRRPGTLVENHSFMSKELHEEQLQGSFGSEQGSNILVLMIEACLSVRRSSRSEEPWRTRR